MRTQDTILHEFRQSQEVLERFLQETSEIAKIEKAADEIVASLNEKRKIISFGNGGSHCDAMHFAEELTGRFREDRAAIPAMAISDPSHISCVANDYGFDQIFSRFLEAFGTPGDVALGITTSGNSANVVHAMKVARSIGMKTIALTGNDGGRVAPLVDIEIRVPHFGHSDRIQEVHIKIVHILILLIEQKLS